MNELKRRVRTCRLLEKMERNRAYSEALKLKNKSIYAPQIRKAISRSKTYKHYEQ